MKLGMQIGLGLRQIVLNRDPASLPHRGTAPPIFGHVGCGQTAALINVQLGTEVGLGPGHTVLDGDPAPSGKGAQPPQFSSHACSGQTAGWIKMPLGREVGLGPGHIMLDEDPAPLPQMGTARTIFGPCLLWPNGHPSQLLLSTCSFITLLCKMSPNNK